MADPIVIATVPVGDLGNANDYTGYGSVSYAYRISSNEVTNAEYVAFLNAKAASDPLGLYSASMNSDISGGITRSGVSGSFTYAVKPEMGNKPVNYVSWYDAIRFANWLNNGQGNGNTETGAYTILGGTATPSNGFSITRNPGATWFLPSEDEWYKAAYYDPRTSAQGGPPLDSHYWYFPTVTNTLPTKATANSLGDVSNPGPNVVNYYNTAIWNGLTGNVTTVGSAGPLSATFYGTNDQGGNVAEWNEAVITGNSRGLRGTYFYGQPSFMLSANRSNIYPTDELPAVGFRVAAVVPEPSSGLMAAIAVGMLCLVCGRIRRSKRNCGVLLSALAVCGAMFSAPSVAAPVTIDWVHVSDAGNAMDPLTGFGAVSRTYQISKFEVTVSQYIEFLNSNDPSGTNSLQLYTSSMVNYGINRDLAGPSGSYYFLYHPETANLPMNLVSWYDAIRFANWLNNGQAPGSTESGAYTLLGGTPIPSNWQSITRSPDAKIFLPSEDEWYKSAYYDPQSQSYYLYPTSSNTTPNASPPTSTPNSLKYASHYSGFTPVGAYTGTTSPYGAFDMAGNVYEWSEGTNLNHQRIVRGGSASDPTAQQMKATARSWCDAFDQTSVIGFRVAAVPEPSSGLMAAMAVGMLWLVRGRIKRSGRT